MADLFDLASAQPVRLSTTPKMSNTTKARFLKASLRVLDATARMRLSMGHLFSNRFTQE